MVLTVPIRSYRTANEETAQDRATIGLGIATLIANILVTNFFENNYASISRESSLADGKERSTNLLQGIVPKFPVA